MFIAQKSQQKTHIKTILLWINKKAGYPVEKLEKQTNQAWIGIPQRKKSK